MKHNSNKGLAHGNLCSTGWYRSDCLKATPPSLTLPRAYVTATNLHERPAHTPSSLPVPIRECSWLQIFNVISVRARGLKKAGKSIYALVEKRLVESRGLTSAHKTAATAYYHKIGRSNPNKRLYGDALNPDEFKCLGDNASGFYYCGSQSIDHTKLTQVH